MSRKLWLPTKTDCVGLPTSWWKASSKLMAQKSWSSVATVTSLRNASLPMTSSRSQRSSWLDTMASDLLRTNVDVPQSERKLRVDKQRRRDRREKLRLEKEGELPKSRAELEEQWALEDEGADTMRCRKIRVYPSPSQKRLLKRWMGTARWTYNRALCAIKDHGVARKRAALRAYAVNRPAAGEEHMEEDCECDGIADEEDTKGLNPIPEWAFETPYDIRDEAANDLLKAYRSAFASGEKFEVKYKSRKWGSDSIVVLASRWGKRPTTSGEFTKVFSPSVLRSAEPLPDKLWADGRLTRTRTDEFYLCLPLTIEENAAWKGGGCKDAKDAQVARRPKEVRAMALKVRKAELAAAKIAKAERGDRKLTKRGGRKHKRTKLKLKRRRQKRAMEKPKGTAGTRGHKATKRAREEEEEGDKAHPPRRRPRPSPPAHALTLPPPSSDLALPPLPFVLAAGDAPPREEVVTETHATLQLLTARLPADDARALVASIDPGVSTLLTVYDPQREQVTYWGTNDSCRIAHMCESLDQLVSRRDKAKGRKKRRMTVAILRAAERIRNRVNDTHRRAAKWLCENYKVILLPRFDTKDMCATTKRCFGSKVARAMYTWAHYRLRQHLVHKARELNSVLHIVREPFTSKTCGCCGTIARDLGGSRVYECGGCGVVMDRDANGARNILLRYLTRLFAHVAPRFHGVARGSATVGPPARAAGNRTF